MYRYVTANTLNQTDIIIYQYGIEDCTGGHSWGPGVRDHFLIHFVHSGKGIFKYNNMTHHLKKGQAFIIYPNTEGFYQADYSDPWTYSWIGFHGVRSFQYLIQANLTISNPIFNFEVDDYIEFDFLRNVENSKTPSSESIKVLSILYMIFSKLIKSIELYSNKENTDRNETYIRKVMEYVEKNYSKKVRISDISNYVGLDRSYLCSLFKAHMNSTLKSFLTNRRISKACELMDNDTLSITDISRLVGYEDPLLFSKAFRRLIKASPSDYRDYHIKRTGRGET